MSTAGVVMFYGSDQLETALRETAQSLLKSQRTGTRRSGTNADAVVIVPIKRDGAGSCHSLLFDPEPSFIACRAKQRPYAPM
jgi:hypothetical protein